MFSKAHENRIACQFVIATLFSQWETLALSAMYFCLVFQANGSVLRTLDQGAAISKAEEWKKA